MTLHDIWMSKQPPPISELQKARLSYRRQRVILDRPKDRDRAKCPWCGKLLRLWLVDEVVTYDDDKRLRIITERWVGEYHGYDEFDTLRCAQKFAHAAFKAGYRRKELEGK